MTVVIVGSHAGDFNRAEQFKRLLRARGQGYVELTSNVWGETRFNLKGVALINRLLLLAVKAPALVARVIGMRNIEAILVVFPGWFDVFWLFLVARAKSVPLFFDPYISLYETVVEDRKLCPPKGLCAWVARKIERTSLQLASKVIVDTPENLKYWSSLNALAPERFEVLPIGSNLRKVEYQAHSENEKTRLLYYGNFIPLHGVDVIIRAASLLEASGTNFELELIGLGQTRARAERLVGDLGLKKCRFSNPVDRGSLAKSILEADLVLGVFGPSEKVQRVVPNKVFEPLSLGRPVITSESEAVKNMFSSRGVSFVPGQDPDALFRAIQKLIAHPGLLKKLGREGEREFTQRYSDKALSGKLVSILRKA